MSIEKDFRNLRNLPFNSFHFWSHFNSVTAFNIYGVESNFNSYRFSMECLASFIETKYIKFVRKLHMNYRIH